MQHSRRSDEKQINVRFWIDIQSGLRNLLLEPLALASFSVTMNRQTTRWPLVWVSAVATVVATTTSNSSDRITAAFSRSDSYSPPRWFGWQHHERSLPTTARHHFSLHPRSAKSKLENSAQSDHNGDNAVFTGGVYVDLGSIAPFNDDILFVGMDAPQNSDTTINATIEEWRSNHWIVLIDDESPIRLAIGDYLHSMGYSVITSVDGPLTFLEIILWSCSWSLLSMNRKNDGEGVTTNQQSPPPWIASHHTWRLPNCIISDVRMPGGIDGVQLLKILRRPSPMDKKDSTADDDGSHVRKKRRGRPKNMDNRMKKDWYDEKDEYELLDGINVQPDKIITPVDQAMRYMDAIQDLLAYIYDRENSGQFLNENTMDYPNSLEQIPVILLTAKAMASDRIEGYKAGANGYLPKPFRPEELLAMVDNMIRRQERERQKFIRTQSLSSANDGANGVENLTPEEANAIALDLAEIKGLIKERLGQQRETEKLQSLLPMAMWMLRMGERRKRVFTKEHIRSILLLQFGIDLPLKMNFTRWEDILRVFDEQSSKHLL